MRHSRGILQEFGITKLRKFIMFCPLLPWIIKLYKSIWRPISVLDVDEDYFAKFVENIFEILSSYIWRKISDVDTGYRWCGKTSL